MIDYPEIKELYVGIDFEDGDFISYSVALGINHDDLSTIDIDKIKKSVKYYSEYVLDSKNQRVGWIYTFDPNSYHSYGYKRTDS